MFGPDSDQTLFLNNLQAVVGPIQELTSRTDPSSNWLFSAAYRGRPVEIGLDRGRGRFSYVRYTAPLAVPVRMFVEGHYASYALATVVSTGDPEFDRRYKVHGNPPDVVAQALDAPLRQWYLATYGDRPPQTDTEHGRLGIFHCFRPHGATHANVPSSQEIAHFLEVVLALTDRLASCYMAQKAAIAASHGAAAAEQWHASNVGLLESVDRTRSRRRMYLFAALAAIFGLPLLGVLLAAVLMLALR